MLRGKLNVGKKDSLKGFKGRPRVSRGIIKAGEKVLPNPVENGLPDGFFRGKMSEEGSLGQVHPLRDGGSGDLVLERRQRAARLVFARQCPDFPAALRRGDVLLRNQFAINLFSHDPESTRAIGGNNRLTRNLRG